MLSREQRRKIRRAQQEKDAEYEYYRSDNEDGLSEYVDWRLLALFVSLFVGPFLILLVYLLLDEHAPFWNDFGFLAGIFGVLTNHIFLKLYETHCFYCYQDQLADYV